MKQVFAAPLALCSLLLAGCLENTTGPVRAPCDPLMTTFTAATGDTVVAANGLRHIELRAGTGVTAASGDGVAVHYSLYDAAGALRESSCATEQTLSFVVGTGQVIPGFWQGVVGMQESGVRRVLVPPALGYGGTDTLTFDIQLVDVLNR